LQIIFALRQTGVKVEEVRRKVGIIEATFFNWKKNDRGLCVQELKRLRQLEDVNYWLMHIIADLTLDTQMLQDVLKKSSEANAAEGVGSEPASGLQSICQ
jgi:putative transposase